MLFIAAAYALPAEEIEILAPEDPALRASSHTRIAVDETLPASAELVDAVQRAPGVVVRRLGGLGDWAAVSIRGASLRQVEVFLDGVPLNPEGVGVVDLSELPLRAFDKVDVYRGLAPAELGASALGGVIALTSGSSPSQSLRWTLGSQATRRASTLISATTANGDLLMAADILHSDGDFRYLDDGGTVYNSDDDRWRRRRNNDKDQLAVHSRWRSGERVQFTILNSLFARAAGVPGTIGLPAMGTRFGSLRNLTLVQAASARGEASGVLRTWTALRDDGLDDRSGSLGGGERWLRSQSSASGVRAVARLGDHRRSIGIAAEGRVDRFLQQDRIRDRRGAAASRLAGEATLFASTSWHDRVGLAPSLQGIWLDDRALVDDATLGTLLPGVGGWLQPAPWFGLHSSVGRFLRAPDPIELFGDDGLVVGRPDLRPERGWQADLGLRLGSDTAHFELIGFSSERQDLITYVQNGRGVAVARNIGRATVDGLELATDARLGHLAPRLNATLSRAINHTPDPSVRGKQLPRIPRLELGATLAWQTERSRLAWDLSWTDGDFVDATNWYKTPRRVLHSLSAWTRLGGGLTAEFEVRNLLDHTAERAAVNPFDPSDGGVLRPLTDFVGFPLPGRTLLLTLRWET